MQDEAFRGFYHRNGLLTETKRAMATLAIEVHVLVAHRTGTVVAAHGILQRPGSVIDGMHQVVFHEQHDGAEYRGFVHRLQGFFQIMLRHGAVSVQHGAQALEVRQAVFSGVCVTLKSLK